jgi:hypothetical protein
MRISKDFILSSIVVAAIALGNIAFYTERYPAFFSTKLSDDTRISLGCIDQSAYSLLESFRVAENLKYESEIPAAAKLNWLQTISADASSHLTDLGDCYDELLAEDPEIDADGVIGQQIEVIIELYEPIFVGEAVNLSRAVREMLGISTPIVSPSPVRMPAVNSTEFIEKASVAVNELSVEIARKVVVR